MAGTIRCLSRMNLSSLTSNITRQFIFNGVRTVYTDEALGLSEFQKTREQYLQRYGIGVNAFHAKMQNIVASDRDMIFTEDLKVCLHLTEKSPSDVELMKKCIYKYNSQANTVQFSTFRFGPVIMRALHYLHEPALAKELFMDSALDNMLAQNTTYTILLDLLHEGGRYQDVIDCYDKIAENWTGRQSYPKMAANILALSCYKLNTPESFEHAMKVWHNITRKGGEPLRKFVTIVAALALKQNKPDIALEMVTSCGNRNYVSIRCIKLMALVEMDRVDEVMMELQELVRNQSSKKNYLFKDTIAKLEAAFERWDLPNITEMRDTLQVMKATDPALEMTLDQHIELPIQQRTNFQKQYPGNRDNDDRWSVRRDRRTFDDEKKLDWYSSR